MKYNLLKDGKNIFTIMDTDYNAGLEKVYMLLKNEDGCYHTLKIYIRDFHGFKNINSIRFIIRIIRCALKNYSIYAFDTDKLSNIIGEKFTATVEFETDANGKVRVTLKEISPLETTGE